MNLPVVFAAFVVGAALTLWFYRLPEHGLAAVLALLPFERLGSFPLGYHGAHLVRPSQVAAAALFAALALKKWRADSRVMLRLWPLALFVLSALVSTALINNGRLWQNFISLLVVVAAFWAVAQTVGTYGFRLARRWLFISASAVSLFGLFQYVGDLAGWSRHLTGLRPEYSAAVLGYTRIHSTAIEPLFFANYLLLPLTIGTALAVGRKLRRWEAAALGLCAVAFLFTESRGAFLAALPAAITLAILTWQRQKNFRWRWLLSAGLIILLAAGGVSLSSKHSRGNLISGPRRFIQLFSTELTQSASFKERFSGEIKAFGVIRHSPWFGVGLGRFETPLTAYPVKRYGYDAIFVNNLPLALACEAGLIGLAFWLWFILAQFGQALIKLHRQLDYVLVGASLAIASILLQSLTFYGFFLMQIWVALGLMAGLAARKTGMSGR